MDRRNGVDNWFDRIDEKRLVAFVENGDGEEVEVPFTWGVCPTCDGKGKHVNPAIDENGISADEFREDPEFAQDYFSGVYDQPCAECDGRRVVPEYDAEAPANKWLLDKERAAADDRRTRYYERMMGA